MIHTERTKMKIAIIGAGAMGGGIACLFVNAGFEVLLLDVAIDEKALWQRFYNIKQPLLAHESKRSMLTLGVIDENLEKLREYDVIIEAVVESEEIKKSLYNKIAKYLKTGAILASNTSTMQLSKLKSLANINNPFIILHFFNPPKIMDLVEVVIEPHDKKLELKIKNLLENDLGKISLFAPDSPGFIANRIGCFFTEMVVRKALAQNIAPELIDYYLYKLFGLPRSGVFGLYDLIGHDVMHFISTSLINHLDTNDLYNDIYLPNDLMTQMLDKQILGNKTKEGFYKKIDDTRYVIQADLHYRPILDVGDEYDNAQILLQSKTPVGKFFSEIFEKLRQYIHTIHNITIEQVDLAMQWGFNWRIPISNLIAMHASEKPCQTHIRTKSVKHKVVFHNKDAICFEQKERIIIDLYSHKGVLTHNTFHIVNKALDYANHSKNINAIILCNTADGFSAGADLKYIHYLINNKNFLELDRFLKLGQDTMLRMKYNHKPIISCAFDCALGGGMELFLNSTRVIANCDLMGGLVESSIGFLPSFGGVKEMMCRARNSEQLIQALHNILIGKKSSSGYYLQDDYSVKLDITMLKHSIINSDLLTQVIHSIPKNRQDTISNKFYKVNINDDEIRRNVKLTATQELLLSWLLQLAQQNRYEQELLNWEREIFLELSKRRIT